MSTDLGKIQYLYDKAVEEKEPIKPLYNEVLELVDSTITIEDNGKLDIANTRDVDAEISNSMDVLRSYIMSSIFSRKGSWASATMSESKLKDSNAEVTEAQLEEINRNLSKDIEKTFRYIQKSNYYKEINKAIMDLIKVGTGAFAIRETGLTSIPFRFEYLGLNNLFILEGAKSEANTVFKLHPEINGDYLKDVFGKDIKMPEGQSETDYETTFDVIECCIPNYDEEKGTTTYNYMVLDESLSQKLLDIELDYKPIVVARWDTIEGNAWGRSVVLGLRGVLKDLNSYKEVFKTQAKKIANPPKGAIMDEGLFYNISLDAGSMNLLGTPNIKNETSPQVFDMGGGSNLMPLDKNITDCRNMIREQLMTNNIGANQVEGKYVSATAVSISHSLFRQRFANTYELINSEILEPTFLGPFIILSKRKLLNINQDDDLSVPYLDIEYQNELSKSTNMEKVNKIMQYAQIVNQIQEYNKAGVALNIPKTVSEISDRLEIDKDLIPTESELKEIQEAQKQQAMQQAQMQQQMIQQQAGGEGQQQI